VFLFLRLERDPVIAEALASDSILNQGLSMYIECNVISYLRKKLYQSTWVVDDRASSSEARSCPGGPSATAGTVHERRQEFAQADFERVQTALKAIIVPFETGAVHNRLSCQTCEDSAQAKPPLRSRRHHPGVQAPESARKSLS
jgi:hypothetical protein